MFMKHAHHSDYYFSFELCPKCKEHAIIKYDKETMVLYNKMQAQTVIHTLALKSAINDVMERCLIRAIKHSLLPIDETKAKHNFIETALLFTVLANSRANFKIQCFGKARFDVIDHTFTTVS